MKVFCRCTFGTKCHFSHKESGGFQGEMKRSRGEEEEEGGKGEGAKQAAGEAAAPSNMDGGFFLFYFKGG